MIRSIGRMLRGVRAGERKLAWNDAAVAGAPVSIALTTPAFAPGASIPRRHAGRGVGENVSPALAWDGVPLGSIELALVIEDPDAPLPRPFVHAIVVGIPPRSRELADGALSNGPPPGTGMLGRNSFGRTGYVGPRPVPGHGPHTYVFQLFAVDRRLSFARPPRRHQLLRALSGAVLARGRLDGRFERP